MRSLYPILGLLAPFVIYGAVLAIPLPPAVGLAMRYDPAIALVVVLLVLYPVFRRSGWVAASSSLCLTLVLFALPLSGLWNSGVSEYPVLMGGLFPFTDGSNYYVDAKRLLDGGRFDAVSSGRPLFAGVLAVLLGLTQQHLQVTLAIVVAITAIACFIVAREIQQSQGVLAALVIIATLFLFYRRFIGSAWTENLGLALGAIAFTLLWRAVQQKQRYLFLYGLLLLTLALNARAGAFFVLPVLVLWGAWFFRNTAQFSRHQFFKSLIYGALVVGLGFALNHWVLVNVGRPDVSFSNFSFTIYAQIVGSKNWRQVGIDYPDVLKLDQPEITYRIYELAWIEFQKNPVGLLKSSWVALSTYLSPTADGALGFISTYGTTSAAIAITVILYLLSLVGLARCIWHWRQPCYALLLVISIGILASTPLAPPWMDGVPSSLRVYAATVPITAILPALGLTVLVKQSNWNPPLQIASEMRRSLPLIMGSFLIVLSILGPIAVKAVSQPPILTPNTCPNSNTLVSTRFHPNSVVALVADTNFRQSHLPNVRLSDFRPGVKTTAQLLANRRSLITNEIRELVRLNSSNTIIDAIDLSSGDRLWVVASSASLPTYPTIIYVCGEIRNNVLYADFLKW